MIGCRRSFWRAGRREYRVGEGKTQKDVTKTKNITTMLRDSHVSLDLPAPTPCSAESDLIFVVETLFAVLDDTNIVWGAGPGEYSVRKLGE